MPAIPPFYHQPKTIDDLVTQYVCRVLAQIGLAARKNVSLERHLFTKCPTIGEKGRGLKCPPNWHRLPRLK